MSRDRERRLGEGRVAGHPLDVLIASDHTDAKQTLTRIVADAGMRPIDAGPLKRVREIEALGYLPWRSSSHSAPTTPAP